MGRKIFAVHILIGLLALVIVGAPSDDVQSSTSTSVSVSTVTRKVTSRSRRVDVSHNGTQAVAEELPAPEVSESDKSSSHLLENGEGASKSLKIKKKILASNLKNISERHNLLKSVANSTEDSDASGKPNASDSAEDDLPEDGFIRSANGTAELSGNNTWSEGSKRKDGGGAIEGRSLEDRSSEENINANPSKNTKDPSTPTRSPTYETYGSEFRKVLNNNFLNNSEGYGHGVARPSSSSIFSSKKSTPISRDDSLKNAIRFDGEYYGPAGQTDWVPIVPEKLPARPQQFGGRLRPGEKLNKTSDRNVIVFPTENVHVPKESNAIPVRETEKEKTTPHHRSGGIEKQNKISSSTEGRKPTSARHQPLVHSTKFRGAVRYESPQSNSTAEEKFPNETALKKSNDGSAGRLEIPVTGASWALTTLGGATRSTEKPEEVTEISVVKVLSSTNHTGKFQNDGVVVPPENVKIENVTKEQRNGPKTTSSTTNVEEDKGKHNESEITNGLPKVMEGWTPERGKLGGSVNETEVVVPGSVDAKQSNDSTAFVEMTKTSTPGLETTLGDVAATIENIPELTATEATRELSSQTGSGEQPAAVTLDRSSATEDSVAETLSQESVTPPSEVDVLPTTLSSEEFPEVRQTTTGGAENESFLEYTTTTEYAKADINTTAGGPPTNTVGVATTISSPPTSVEVTENKMTSNEAVTVINITSTPVAAVHISNSTESATTEQGTEFVKMVGGATAPATETAKTITPATAISKATASKTTTAKITTPATTTAKKIAPTTKTPETTTPTSTTPADTTGNHERKSEAAEEGIYYKNYIPTTIDPHDEITEENVPAYLRLTVQAASWEELCRLKEDLRESIVKMLGGKNVSAESVHFLNLNDRNCEEKIEEARGDSLANRTLFLPVNMFLMDRNGDFDKNLSEAFLTLWGRRGLDFELPIRKVDFVTPIVNLTELADSPLGGSVVAAIVISCVAGICVILLGILFVIMKRRQKRFNYGQRCTPVSLDAYSLDSVSIYNSVRRKGMRASKRSYGNAAFDDPEVPTHPMNFAGIANFSSDKEQLYEEFNVIAQVYPKAEELPAGAETKNRYANIIPLPETRVHLSVKDGDPLSDYINANYVRGSKGAEKLYIACQAPMDSTIEDFWRMVWEQQCKVILMLTDLQENGIEKCADYLPPNEVTDNLRLFGDFQVTLKKRDVKEKYIVSNLKLKNLEANLWREVTHLWYLGWPDQGVPPEANSLIAFLIEARSQTKVQNGATTSGPAVVHCSPGTGRTGTVIACDLCIREYEQSRMVDVPKCVFSLRRDRAGAVQTKDQYAFIYQVLNVYATKLSGGGIESI